MSNILVISNYSSFTSARPEFEAIIGLQRDFGHTICIITTEKCAFLDAINDLGIKVYNCYPTRKFSTNESDTIKEIIQNHAIDVCFFFTSRAMINGLRATKGLSTFNIGYRGYTGNIHWYDPSLYLKYAHPRIHKIWCISASIQNLFNKNLIDKEKAIHIPKGHDVNWYSNVEKKDLSEFGIQPNDFVVTCVGNARKMKGIRYLVEGFCKINNKSIKLMLVGNNMQNKEITKIIKKYNNSNIIFTGFRKDNLEIVKSSDVYILPSIYGEAINKTIIEAQSMKIPCIATNIEGNVDLVIDNKTAIAIPIKNPDAIKDAIIHLYRNPEERMSIAENAFENIVENINSKITTKKLNQLITLKGTI